VRAVTHLSPASRDRAVMSLMENLHVLYPIFPTVMMVIRGVISELSVKARQAVFAKLRELINNKSYICTVPVNLAFAIRVLAADNTEETDTIFVSVYDGCRSMLIRRDIILALASHNVDYWISAQIKRFSSCTLWEKRALIIGSYILEDEGSYWRDRVKKSFSTFDRLMMDWAAEQKNKNRPVLLG
jgi:hypothetical protein